MKNDKKDPAKTLVMKALKDFNFGYDRKDYKIKKGDDIAKLGLTEPVIQNLITEGVLKG